MGFRIAPVPRLASIAFALAVVSGCGRTSHGRVDADAAAGSGGVLGSGSGMSSEGGGTAGDADGATGGTAGAPDFSVPLDASSCAARPLSDCEGVDIEYGPSGSFERTPALAQCQRFISHDGCATLEFAFDAEGCAVSVSPGPNGWRVSGHLSELQACMTEAFEAARYACLASGTLTYHESCFIR